MSYSVFDLFKVGIGPSSSHTVGPMVAGGRFIAELKESGQFEQVTRVSARLHGSLAHTGKGHASDVAVLLGLGGHQPDTIDPADVTGIVEHIRGNGVLNLAGEKEILFTEPTDLIFDFEEVLPAHSNGMCLYAYGADGNELRSSRYYSIGGGFVANEEEMSADRVIAAPEVAIPYDYTTAEELLRMGEISDKTFPEMVFSNECAWASPNDVRAGLDNIWNTMRNCMERGMKAEGILPGGLDVKRRAKYLRQTLDSDIHRNAALPHECMDWISLWAIAVNEENASGGRIVTAPTNGAAGVIPAVIRYYEEMCPGADKIGIHDFLLAATAVGILIKLNASISGAEAGCQGEVGSACAMAAGGLAAALGGTNKQVENAAEIGLEHHLGMTCDPVGGLVQIPCIERNAMGAVKAINAASLALRGDGDHYVTLDAVIETMRQTGEDMQSKYKETSQGGLAVNVVAC
ncbi:MAG: L-serine ammonia-lyase [Rhodospirillales bacterium]|nr:L-serine ammonia-lyase [Rhodospirillales bacterium]MBT4041458.1 L-serine ammonia-lyase [Rhodospirillales bacterium]MBT4625141.1 L-serine ammonia-lyase [Rhodospirillales bacterium]MBT5519696.1 L-serine ammonia-lyase [Rhodospirillales bacterium]MBT6109242.1 L-serine ammonia-lyase [Rhodospirillales bacterium]